jgi:hypothetical protein
MRYDELLAIYPDIPDLFTVVAGLIHETGAAPEMADVWARQWIKCNIADDHQKPVGKKIHQFIAAICGEEERVKQCNILQKSTNAPTTS